MNELDAHIMEHLFTVAEEFITGDEEDLELPFDLDEELPPYPILLALLLDWANKPDSDDESRHPAFATLLRYAMQHLRYGLRQQDEEAAEWWTILQDTLRTALKEKNDLLCGNLIRGFADLDLVLPEELIPAAAEWHFENFQHFSNGAKNVDNLVEFPQHPDAVLHSMLEQLEPESATEIYEILKPELHYLPLDGVSMIAQQLLSSKQSIVCNAASLLLLHPRPAVRETLINLLSNQQFLSGIDAVGRNRLILLRNYLPKDHSDQLDKAIKTLNRRNLSAPPTTKLPIQIWATAMDGAGATALAALRSVGSRCQVSGIILKEGVGIVDCWETTRIKKSEAKQTLSVFREHLPQSLLVDDNYLQQLIPHYLYLNKTSGELPEPSLLEWLEKLGDGRWQPNRFQFQQWLESKSPELENQDQHAAFLRCVRWYDRERDSLRWWEESEEVDDAVHQLLQAEGTSFNEDEIFEKVFEPFRPKWLERFIQLSLWAQCSASKTKPRWQDFALLALAVHNNTPFADLPIIPAIIEDTLHAAAQKFQEDVDSEEFDDIWLDESVDEDWEEEWEDDGQPFTPDLFGDNRIQPAKSEKVGRNQSCPCGSGKKYKQCCGK